MADIYLDNHYRRWNKCFNRRDFHIKRWTYTILLIFCVYLQCVSSACNGLNITVGTYPEGDIRIRYNSKPLEIFCTAEQTYSSEDIEFSINDKILSDYTTVINKTTIRLLIEKPEKQDLKYYCTNKVTKKNCINKVLVDEEPPDVTDFKCRSNNLESLNCSWSWPQTRTSISYNVTFNINGRPVKPIVANKTGNIVSCEWTLITNPPYRQQLAVYNISLYASNDFGRKQQNFIIDHYGVVIPKRPQNLSYYNKGPHSVVLKWSISRTIADLLPQYVGLDHKIEYQVEKSKEFHRVNTSSLSPLLNDYKFVLGDLPYAYMQYEVRVYVKSRLAPDEDEFWSKFSYEIFETLSEKPNRPPETAVGAFKVTTLNSHRKIFIYWKQLEEYERNGPNFTYKAIVTQDDKIQEYFADKQKSLSYIDIKEASTSALHVLLKSFNNEGASQNSSYLYVPAESDVLEGPNSFTKLAYQNGTYVLYWDMENVKNITEYTFTLFWCPYNISQVCVGRMNFTYLKELTTLSYVIENLPKDTIYQFAISVNNGIKSSGMYWAQCEISPDIFPMQAFPVTLNHESTGKNYVTLSWTMPCAVRKNIVVGYNISYCPVVRDSDLCDNTFKNESILVTPESVRANITNLLPYKTYRFNFGLNTTFGLKEIKNATDYVTTLDDTCNKPENIFIIDVTNNSLNISWNPPKVPRCAISKYLIYNYSTVISQVEIDNRTNTDRRHVILYNLLAFTNYSLRVQACNSYKQCSKMDDSDGIFVRTCIGPPSTLKTPSFNSNSDFLIWSPPEHKAGTVDMYQVNRTKDDIYVEIYNTTDRSFQFKLCEGVDERETFQVRAVNFDEDLYHGAFTDNKVVSLKPRNKSDIRTVHFGKWSEPAWSQCKIRNTTFLLTFLFIGLLLLVIGVGYASLKVYRRYRKMEDIKPVLPTGLGLSEKEIGKYSFGNWNQSSKDDKASSDEVRLLPNKTSVPSPEIKQESICTSAHTDSTAVSETSKEPVDREPSTSEEGSESSLQSEVHVVETRNEKSDSSDNESSSDTETSPYMSDPVVKKLPNTGYVQHAMPDPMAGYMKSAPARHEPIKNLPVLSTSPTTSSYVVAGLSPPPIFTTGVPVGNVQRLPTGYVMPEDTRAHSFMNFPKLGPSPTKINGPDSLPTIVPPILKPLNDIQLQPLSGTKPPITQTKPGSGYVAPGDALLNKHLSIVAGVQRPVVGAPHSESALSPDAYCRFSWSKDPSSDNLHSWLADSPGIESPDLAEMHS